VRGIAIGLLLAAGWPLTEPAGADQASRSAPSIVSLAQAYASRYQREAPMLIARERYVQNQTDTRGVPDTRSMLDSRSSLAASRTLISELVMVRLPGEVGWVTFRDVLEVDGRPLRDREQRLLQLLQSPSPDSLAQARKLATESARYNLGRITRTLNVPDIGLSYLDPAHTSRMAFDAPEKATVSGVAAVSFRFREVAGPSIIRSTSGGNLLAAGRIWAAATGEILRTELTIRDRQSIGRCTVDFRREPGIEIRVPSQMTERYTIPAETVDTVATYSDFRQFSVATSESIKKPGER
jgi:hypothetical protein